MTATLKPKALRDLHTALTSAHPESEFQHPIPVNNATSALMRVLTTKDADTVESWLEFAGYKADVQANQGQDGYIVEFWQPAKVKEVKRT